MMKILFAALLVSYAHAKTSPVTKIVNMLKEMTTQLQTEQEQDDDMMETMNCWCTTYDKEKTAAILAAEDSIASLLPTLQRGHLVLRWWSSMMQWSPQQQEWQLFSLCHTLYTNNSWSPSCHRPVLALSGAALSS